MAPAAEVEAAAEPVEAVVPAEPQEPAPALVLVENSSTREPLSIADDGAGLHEQWFLLLEDWQGLAAIFAGNRDKYTVLARTSTQLMSEQVAQAVPTEAANLEHWVTMLIRELPAGVWLRSFASVRSVTDQTLEEPLDLLGAVIAFYGTPAPNRSFEVFGKGDIDGSLTVDADSGELLAAQAAQAETEDVAEAAAEDVAEAEVVEDEAQESVDAKS